MATIPTRIDQALFDAAKASGALHSRSTAQQLDHWIRLGRELEASPALTHGAVERVLAGQGSFDELSGPQQVRVRATWRERIDERLAGLDLRGEFEAGGRAWVEADADGTVVVREPGAG